MIPPERIDQALAWARDALAGASESAALDASVLLASVLGVDRVTLYAHPERLLTPDQAERYAALVRRGADGEPLAYLTGMRAFYDGDFSVTPAVLVPRPETEHLVEAALTWARGRDALRAADIGTGSGIIAVTLAAHLPGASVWAVDLSPAALDVARHNAARAGVAARITFLEGDLLEPLRAAGVRVDLLAANLPYIARDELEKLPVSRHEPRLALDGGADGLDLIRRLLAQAPAVLEAGGLVLLEIGAGQGERVTALARDAFPAARITVLRDLAGHERVVRIDTAG